MKPVSDKIYVQVLVPDNNLGRYQIRTVDKRPLLNYVPRFTSDGVHYHESALLCRAIRRVVERLVKPVL